MRFRNLKNFKILVVKLTILGMIPNTWLLLIVMKHERIIGARVFQHKTPIDTRVLKADRKDETLAVDLIARQVELVGRRHMKRMTETVDC